MNGVPSSLSAVPSIHIHDTDDFPTLFDVSGMFPSDIPYFVAGDTGAYHCPLGLQSQYTPPNATPHPSAELEGIPELSHLTTTNQVFLTGDGYSLPHSTIVQETGTTASVDGRLSPSSLGSSAPSPTSSFGSSLSPLSLYDALAFSEGETPLSPSPAATPDQQFTWGLNHRSSDSLVLSPFMRSLSNDVPLCSPGSQTGPQRPRSSPSPSRPGPVASKAMLEANGRRRRHPVQFECQDCGQTFTAQFSLKRHAQSHTGERPFACRIPGCTQRFFNSSDCKRHEKSKKRHKDMAMV